jgi:hypothetical protein
MPKPFKAPWGEIYGGSSQYQTPKGGLRWMCRKGQRVRFYTSDGEQVGPEQSNVAPAIAWAQKQGWRDSRVGITGASYLRDLGTESARTYAPVIRRQASDEGVDLPLSDEDVSILLANTIRGLHQERRIDWDSTSSTRQQIFIDAWVAEMNRQGIRA